MKFLKLIVATLLCLSLCSCSLVETTNAPSTTEHPLSVRDNARLKLLEVSFSDADVEELQDSISACKKLCRTGKAGDEDSFLEALYDTKAQLDWIDYQRDVAYLLYMYDMSDKNALETYQHIEQTYLELHSEFWQALWDMRQSYTWLSLQISKFMDEIYPNRMDLYFDNDEYYLELLELELEFDQYHAEGTAKEIHEIYTDYLVAARAYAESYGYDNYYEYQTDIAYHRDYGKDKREQFREYVKQYIVPLYMEYDAYSDEVYDSLGFFEQWRSDSYSDKAYDLFEENYLGLYFDSLPSAMGDVMYKAFEQDWVIIGDKPKSSVEACVTVCGDYPVCYFHESMLDLVTVSHELGHFYARKVRGYSGDISLDMREVYSQANSLLMLRYLRDVIDSRTYDAFEIYEVSNILYQIVLSTVKDEFDEIVFSDPEAHTYSAEELTAIMEELIVEYGIGEIGGSMERYARTYWHRLGLYDPGYQLSYATSAVVVLQIYQMSESDYAAATECYRLLVEKVNKSSSFLGTIKNAGLQSPFDEDVYLSLEFLLEKEG